MKIDTKRKGEMGEENLYPLYGTVETESIEGDKIVLEIEDLRNSDPVNDFELMIPSGYIDSNSECHSLLCENLKDIKERFSFLEIKRCNCSYAECDKYWENIITISDVIAIDKYPAIYISELQRFNL